MYVKSDCSFLFNRWKVGHSDPCLSHVQSRGGGGRGRNRSRCKRGERQTIPNGNNYSQIFSVAFLPWNGTFKLFWCIRRLIVSFTAARRHLHFVILASFPPDLSSDWDCIASLVFKLTKYHLSVDWFVILCFCRSRAQIMLIPLEIFVL